MLGDVRYAIKQIKPLQGTACAEEVFDRARRALDALERVENELEMAEESQAVHEPDEGKTLVDCGCRARVHPDGSGVEIDWCPLHAAAGKLLAACELALRKLGAPITHYQDVYATLTAAIAAAENR